MTKQVTISASLWETTAQFSHAGVACAIMLAARAHFSLKTALIVGAVGIVAAAGKEFGYDAHFETTDARGSDLMDFSFYVLGLVIGFFVGGKL
jgi:hypothetical protein